MKHALAILADRWAMSNGHYGSGAFVLLGVHEIIAIEFDEVSAAYETKTSTNARDGLNCKVVTVDLNGIHPCRQTVRN